MGPGFTPPQYIFVLILAIVFYKITFYFPLTISLVLLRVMLHL